MTLLANESIYTLSEGERKQINKIAHKRAQELAPSHLYRNEFIRQRDKLRTQFCKMMSAGLSFERAKLEIELAEIRKAIDNLA